MITEKTNIRMDSIFSDDKKHRFLLRRSWAKEGKIATVIMINPSDADYLITDVTTMSVYNGLARLVHDVVDERFLDDDLFMCDDMFLDDDLFICNDLIGSV